MSVPVCKIPSVWARISPNGMCLCLCPNNLNLSQNLTLQMCLYLWLCRRFSVRTKILHGCVCLCVQEIFLLPSCQLPVVQVPAACPAEWVEGVSWAEGGAPQGFLQHSQGSLGILWVRTQIWNYSCHNIHRVLWALSNWDSSGTFLVTTSTGSFGHWVNGTALELFLSQHPQGPVGTE